MNYEVVFSVVGVLAFIGWGLLLFSPLIPTISDRIAGVVIPLILSVLYLLFVLLVPAEDGGFESFAQISVLFANPGSLMAGWIHFLAFDLLIGAWVCRVARSETIVFWLVAPCLILTFLFGPIGYLAFTLVSWLKRRPKFN